MSETTPNTQSKNAPVERFNDGAVKATIFRNISKEGRPFYNVTFARTYTDNNDNIRETQSFSGTDVLKVRRLADQAYHAVDRLKKQDRAQFNEQQSNQETPAQNEMQGKPLSEQRDVLMNNQPHSNGQSTASQTQVHNYNQRGPEIGQ